MNEAEIRETITRQVQLRQLTKEEALALYKQLIEGTGALSLRGGQ